MLISATTLSFGTLILGGCNNPDEIEPGRTNVTTEDLSENTEELIGQTVTVKGQVEEELGNLGFVLQEDNLSAGGLPVIVADAEPLAFSPGEIPVQATGEVVRLQIADVENEYGIDLDDELFADYEGQPAIVAESLAFAPTPEELANQGDAFIGLPVAVQGEVGGVYSEDTVAIYEEGWIDDVGVVVVGVPRNLSDENGAVEEGDYLTITGTARPFDPSLQQEYDLGPAIQENLQRFVETYEERPVIVADEVYPSAIDE